MLAATLPAVAQSGWSQAGTALGSTPQSSQDAYNRGVMQGAEQAYLLESARGAKLEADRLEAENTWKSTLATVWVALGLSKEEATSVASTYQLTNDQEAILVRVQHQELKTTVADAMAAYKSYNYQLANQLLVASYIVLQSQKSNTSGTAEQPSQASSVN